MVFPQNSMRVPPYFLSGDDIPKLKKNKKKSKRSRGQHRFDMNARVRRGEVGELTCFRQATRDSTPSSPPPTHASSSAPLLPLHQLVARARRLVVFYCVLRGPVHRHGPEKAAAADLEEIDEVSEAAMATERRSDGEKCVRISNMVVKQSNCKLSLGTQKYFIQLVYTVKEERFQYPTYCRFAWQYVWPIRWSLTPLDGHRPWRGEWRL